MFRQQYILAIPLGWFNSVRPRVVRNKSVFSRVSVRSRVVRVEGTHAVLSCLRLGAGRNCRNEKKNVTGTSTARVIVSRGRHALVYSAHPILFSGYPAGQRATRQDGEGARRLRRGYVLMVETAEVALDGCCG